MAVSMHSFVASGTETAEVLAEIGRMLDAPVIRPHFVFVFYSAEYDDALIHSFLLDRFGDIPLIGGTSGSGVMSDSGMGSEFSIGILTITDPDGLYGVAAAPLDSEDVSLSAERALQAALEQAGARGELPDLVWVYQSPGREEAVLAGLRRVVGDRCPIVGGSAASGARVVDWRLLGPEGPMRHALLVGALLPSGGVSVAFQGGFQPSGSSGVVTTIGEVGGDGGGGVSLSRRIATIDGERAVDVYNRWNGGVIAAEVLARGGTIADESGWWPLGVATTQAGDLTYYRLVHIEAVGADGSLKTYSGVADADRVYGMRGTKSGLINRATRVAAAAVGDLRDQGGEAAGALMAYCIGCRTVLGSDIDGVAGAAAEGFHGIPFVGCFTAGEQGPAMGANVHANLMIAAVVFGR